MENLVTIITPSYNSASFIPETINSVLEQTYSKWEMIIVDDSSLDNSVQLIKSLMKNHNKIKLIELNENVGAAEARNIALKSAQGNFIAFLDSDDIWYPQKLEKQISYMKKNDFPISFTSYEIINSKGELKNKSINAVKKLDQHDYLKNTIIGFSTSIINRDIVGYNFKFINIRTRQDTSLWIDLLGKGFNAYGLPEILVQYRIHSNSISANRFKAAKQVWNLYYRIHKFGTIKSLFYFFFYAMNAIKKRL